MMTVRQLADVIDAEVLGSEDSILNGPDRIENAAPGTVTFLQHPKYLSALKQCHATAIISTAKLADRSLPFTWLIVTDPYAAFAMAVSAFHPIQTHTFSTDGAFIQPETSIGQNVRIGSGTYIGTGTELGDGTVIYPQVYVGNNVRIGKNCVLYPGVKVMDRCDIGDGCILHPGAVMGADGFGFAPLSDGSYRKIPQMGKVILEDYVEIGANTCIDRATLGETIIRRGSKIDNLVQVGHNVVIGEHAVIAAQAGFAGSSQIGHHLRAGGQAGFAPHIKVAPYTQVNAQSGVSKDIAQEKTTVTGSPAEPYLSFYRKMAFFKKLEREWKPMNESLHLLQQSLKKDD
jgi:UDP-3-O-[3-hydroxymyristoyl] glucosamine N-acyltransferase